MIFLSLLGCAHRPPSDGAAPSTRVAVALEAWSSHAPESVDWDAAGFSNDEWYVSFVKGQLVVDHNPPEQGDALPFTVDRRGEADLGGERHVLAVEGGYLVGFNAGEFGGGAWWFSADGARRKKLTLRASDPIADYVPENVHGFAHLDHDVLVFEGLTHGGGNWGRVVRLHRGSDAEWYPSVFAELSACPHAVVTESASNWLFATTSGIWRLDAQAHALPVWQPVGSHLYYPNTIVRDRSGVVYMGMRAFVVMLTPRGTMDYVVRVLAPPRT